MKNKYLFTNLFLSLIILLSASLVIENTFAYIYGAVYLLSSILAITLIIKQKQYYKTNSNLQDMATSDPLTQLFNRRGIEEFSQNIIKKNVK